MLLKKSPDVAWRTIEGQAVLVHNREGEVQVLNEVGTYVWEHFDEGLERIVSGIANVYDVSPETVRPDVEEFIQELVASNLVLQTQEA
jgi:hypothetical protein